MQQPVTPLQKLSVEEKARLFVHAQKLLVQHHPRSEFIFREDNVGIRMKQVKELVSQYKGFCYADDNIVVLFNYIMVTDDQDAVSALQAHKFKEPSNPFNGVSIDFVVFRKLQDCMDFCKANYNPDIRHIVYSHEGKPRIIDTPTLLSKTLRLPKSTP